MFITRAISSVVLVILMVGIFLLGAPATGVAVMLISIKGVQELLRVFKLDKSIYAVIAYIATVVFYVALLFGQQKYALALIVVYLLLVLSVYVFSYPKYTDKDMMGAFLAFIYVSVMLSYIFQIRALEPSGLVLVFLIFVSSWINDVFAYLVGKTIGKHKMTPKLSPKKSVEGFIGGIVGAGIAGMIFGYVYNIFVEPMAHSVLIFGVIGAIGAIPAVIGDLAASAIKRNHDVKDYGHLIPGHGGILDRFDSVIFTAPIVYYLLSIMANF